MDGSEMPSPHSFPGHTPASAQPHLQCIIMDISYKLGVREAVKP